MNGSFSKFMTMALVCAVSLAAALPVQAYQSPLHIFTLDDIQGDFNGFTYGHPNKPYPIICGINGVTCPAAAPDSFMDKEGVTLYPIDSEFGFYVVDFLGAKPKVYDEDYMEGWAGQIMDGDTAVGVKLSNAETDRYKVKPPMGTWCQGLGNTSIKCSTEHYSAMEHVLSCHEVIPYRFADPEQAILTFSDIDPEFFDCSLAELDDDTFIFKGGSPFEKLISVAVVDDPPEGSMAPNDNTTVMDNIAVGSDYSVTLKDDGKALYRWGGMIKRPNDIRLYARLKLPDQWKQEDDSGARTDYKVTKAVLKVEHWITNNPNDQLRPEDLENEAAKGRKPDYRIEDDGSWVTTRDCFEGDADYIDSDEASDLDEDYAADEIPKNTFLKNAPYAGSPAGNYPPQIFSSDLRDGYTNAYYTTTNRDPFEWSYLKVNADPNVHEFQGSLVPLQPWEMEGLVGLVSGPRWRLRANKFGQDICGLEIPLIECSPPPFKKDNIKYEVGEKVTTVINLLDWKDDNSPLNHSFGWIDTVNHNLNVETKVVNHGEGFGEVVVSSNGLPMTEDFDLAVYIKGDRKPVALFNAWLEIEYEGEILETPEEWNVAIIDLLYDETVTTEDNIYVHTVVENYGPYVTPVDVQLLCVDNRGNEWLTSPILPQPPYVLEDDENQWFAFEVEQNTGAEKPATLNCLLEAIAEGDINPLDNFIEFTIKVKKYKE